jgi:hypothetical protein
MPTLDLLWYESLTSERTAISRSADLPDRPALKASPAATAEPALRRGRVCETRRNVMDVRWDDQLSHVTAMLNYLQPTDSKPVAYAYEPPPGTPWRTGEYVDRSVRIRDARPILAGLSLDEQGFAVTRSPSEVANFYDEDEVRAVYYPEVERLVRTLTGAARVLVFDHNLRNAVKAAAGEDGIREPVRRVHNDFTAGSGPKRARAELAARGIDPDEALRSRFALINVWRPVSRPVAESPIALCDASSIEPDDLVATDLVFRHRVGETYSITFNQAHRWFYVPGMSPDEALLIKCFDSAEDGRARFTAHTSFDDPSSPPDAPPRESIEARTLVLFPPEAANGRHG